MATTPVTRVTDLTRSHRLDIDTADFPASQYQQMVGVEELKLVEEYRVVSDEVHADGGAMREEVTGYNWRIEAKIKWSTNLAGTSRDPVQAFVRGKFVALRTGPAAVNEFGMMLYDKNGLAGEADEGRVFVKTWTTDGTNTTDTVQVVLQGQGPLTPITNPAASQVPGVTGLDPATGVAAGGELVNIFGHHFTGATDVDFASDAADFIFVSDSHIVAVAPPHAAGTVQVKVTTPAGASPNVTADNYIYTA